MFGNKGGSVINISYGVTSLTPANSAIYTGTKGAVDAITGVLAKELGARQIRVNAINPGMIETEGAQTMGVRRWKAICANGWKVLRHSAVSGKWTTSLQRRSISPPTIPNT